MFGKAYDFHRQTGHMTMDTRQRMTNRAEVGLGMVGMFGLLFVIGLFILLVA